MTLLIAVNSSDNYDPFFVNLLWHRRCSFKRRSELFSSGLFNCCKHCLRELIIESLCCRGLYFSSKMSWGVNMYVINYDALLINFKIRSMGNYEISSKKTRACSRHFLPSFLLWLWRTKSLGTFHMWISWGNLWKQGEQKQAYGTVFFYIKASKLIIDLWRWKRDTGN